MAFQCRGGFSEVWAVHGLDEGKREGLTGKRRQVNPVQSSMW